MYLRRSGDWCGKLIGLDENDFLASAAKGERAATVVSNEKAGYNRFLLLVAGLGGLLYGVDVGIIAGALPYLEATSGLNAGQLSIVVAAVLLGSVSQPCLPAHWPTGWGASL
jgi:hypothetical protein